ncbi:MAG: Uncharacterised protein [Acidimicrobiaceae bacterium]|nr:hypothetical protein [Acidimicrobiaceae bacterium]CAI8367731.1 MAG: Uncharacterised protein [Acidimicrobiaceae bacterium]
MEKVRTAALSMPQALEDYPFGEGITVFRIFDRKGPIFTILSEEKGILNVRVPRDFFEICDTIEGFAPLKVWKNWITVDLTLVNSKREINDLVAESWHEVTENLPKKKRDLLNNT